MVRIEQVQLAECVNAGIITGDQAARLWAFLLAHGERADAAASKGPRFTFTNVLYYLGGMLAIGALSLFMTLGFERFGGSAILFIALAYMAVAWALAERFESRQLVVLTGIMAALIVVLVPLAVFGLQHALGMWPPGGHAEHYRDYHYEIDWRWATLELVTLVAGAAMLYRHRTPFLVMPIAVTLWYMSMDFAMLLMPAGTTPWSAGEWQFRKWFSIVFGLSMLALAFVVDVRSRFGKDYAFWLYLFGMLAFWGGLSSLGSDLLSGKLVYLAINVVLVLLGALLVRRVFTVFGAIGIAIVLSDISYRFFKDSWLFPIALTLIGLAIVYAGIWWSRNESRVSTRLQRALPSHVRELIASRMAQTLA